MRNRLIGLALAAMVALSAGGVAAATVVDAPAAVTATPSQPALPDEHTLTVVDPDDALSEQDVDDAVALAWSNETVRSHFEDDESVHVEVVAVGETPWNDRDVAVEIADEESTRATAIADVDLDAGAVIDVRRPIVLGADEIAVTRISAGNVSVDGETVTFEVDNDSESDE